MRVQNKMSIMQMPWHANMTEKNHLGAALLIKPQALEGKMNQLFTSFRYSQNPLTKALTGVAEETLKDTEWNWDMRGADSRPLISMGIVDGANTTPGKYNKPFKIRLDQGWYLPGDIIHPGASNKKYQVRIQEAAVRSGGGWEYIVVGNWGKEDTNMSMPIQYLQAGQKWGKLFSQYGEASEQSGSTQYSMPIKLKSRMSRYRKHYRVTGDAANQVLAVKMAGKDGKMYDMWIKYAEVVFWEQWYRELERGYWYSRMTDEVLDANGRSTLSGPGVQQLLEDSTQHSYSHLSAKLLEEFIMDVLYARVAPGDRSEIEAYSGEYGMLNFHRAIDDVLSKKGWKILDSNFEISKDKSPYNTNALAFGYQFTKIRMANGAILTLKHNPCYDDTEINFEIDPVSGYPTESQRITFLDFAPGKGSTSSSNIKLHHLENGFKHGYVNGLQSPFGPVNNGAMAHPGDYYEVHVQKQCGVHIEDVTRCGELILARN